MLLDVSAIILNYRDAAMTKRCVDAFESSAREIGVDAEVVIVDNSGPETGGELRSLASPRRTVLVNETNRGFAAANNQGVLASKGRILIPLNNDAFMTPDCLSRGISSIESMPNVGIWAPALKYEGGAAQQSVGPAPSLWSHFKEYLLPGRFAAQDGSRAALPEPIDVPTVSGAVMFMPRTVYEEIKGFDEAFFFTVEDVDLCTRMRSAGYRVVYDPRASMVHLGGSSQPWKWIRDPHLHKARILYFRKHGGIVAATIASMVTGIGLALRALIQWIRRDR